MFGPLSLHNWAPTLADRGEKLHSKTLFLYFGEHFSIQTCVTTGLVCTCKRAFQTSACKPRNQCKHQHPVLISYLEANSVASTV